MELVLIKSSNRYVERGFNSEDKLEKIIFDHSKTFLGDKTILINIKRKIETKVFGGTVPDAFLIDLKDIDNPEFYLVEIELSKDDFC
jgi:hypothetical protein